MLTIFVLYFFDHSGRVRSRRSKVAIRADDLRSILVAVQAVFPGARIIEAWAQAGTMPAEKTRVVVEADLAADADAASILALLEQQGATGIHSVTLEEE